MKLPFCGPPIRETNVWSHSGRGRQRQIERERKGEGEREGERHKSNVRFWL